MVPDATGVFVKICGITTEEDALLAVAMGADALGFNFVSGSKRQVSPSLATDIVKRVPPEIISVGVFRDELPERVVEICHRAGLRGAQLHGHESPAQAAYVAERVPFTIQAFPAGDPTIDRAREYPVTVIMLDNPTPGSGQVFDWSLTDGVPDGKLLLLAGGLTPANVADAIARVRPWGVDVATGVESEPGRKDARKVRAFIANAKAAASQVPRFEPGDDPPYDWQEDL